RSRGEFTVAKDQNVRLRTGWFSDRSATFLAAGRAVVTQDTAFGAVLPTGKGLFAVNDVDTAAAAIEQIAKHPKRAGRAAAEIAREYFDATRVLGALLAELGIDTKNKGKGQVTQTRGTEPASTVEIGRGEGHNQTETVQPHLHRDSSVLAL